jgi:hypothetical protein
MTEKLEKDSKYVTKQGAMVQALGSFYLFVVGILSVVALIEFRSGGTEAWNGIVAAGSLGVQMLIQTGYLMILTVLTTAEILAPRLYTWLESLPFSRKEVGSLRIMALAREFLAPLTVIVVATPLVSGLAGQSLLGGVVGLFVGLIHGAFTLGLSVLASWKMRGVLHSGQGNDKKAKLTRIFTMLVYGVGTVTVVFAMQIGSSVIAQWFNNPALEPDAATTLAAVLALVPLPTAPAYLILLVVGAQHGVAAGTPIWMPMVGTVLYAGGALLMLARVRALILRRPDEAHPHAAATPSTTAADLTIRTPRGAYRHQIARAATADTQVLIALLFPLILPLLSVVGPILSGQPEAFQPLLVMVMAAGAGGWMVIHGMTRLQFGSAVIEAALPTVERDRVFPRAWIAAIVPAIGAAIPLAFFLELGDPSQAARLAEVLVPTALVPAALLIKLALFGRRESGSDRIVLDEVRPNARFGKWVLVVATLVVGTIGLYILHGVLMRALAIASGTAVYVAVLGALAAAVVVLYRRMFRDSR